MARPLPDASKESIAYFRGIPWCSNLLGDPALIPMETPSRTLLPEAQHSLLAQTLHTNETVRECLSFYKPSPKPPERHPQDAHKPKSGSGSGSDSDIKSSSDQVYTLFSLGDGLNAHKHVCHGGFVAVLLDETMALAVRLRPGMVTPFTLRTNIQYKKPIFTPAVVLCRAYFTKVEGRKSWVTATIEDERGQLYAMGESLWMEVKMVEESKL
ncbi:MAG: hypothetical protein M1837_005234 [Sclerophora amabilis]|nr:MAG: hypothetical protein M1837_005234 [Sclerophora amabilis]